MKIDRLRKNSWYTVASLIGGIFFALFQSIWALWSPSPKKLKRTHFVESLHYFFVVWPKQFWKNPTGVKMGRSFGTLLAFFVSKDRFFEASKNRRWVTMIELMVALSLLSLILILAFSAFGNIAVLRNLVTGRVDVNEQLYNSVERLVTTIKEGGTIDYEEYFNRSLIGTSLSGGYYRDFSGYGNYGRGGEVDSLNFGSGSYICRSTPTAAMGSGGCTSNSLNTQGISQIGIFQRYGSYRSQFIDANSDRSNDPGRCPGRGFGDSNCDGNILGDEDDEDLGNGPIAFSGSTFSELYLQKKIQTTHDRLFLRRRVIRDPDAPSVASCDTVTGAGAGCIGILEMRRLRGRDFGIVHSPSTPSEGRFDGITDTWVCHPDFSCGLNVGGNLLPTSAENEWVPLLSSDIDVRSLGFTLSPNKDFRYAWRGANDSTTVAGMVRISLTVGYSWKKRKLLKIQNPEVTTTTSISLEN